MYMYRCSNCRKMYSLENINGKAIYFSLQPSQKILCMECLEQHDELEIVTITKYFVVIQESDF